MQLHIMTPILGSGQIRSHCFCHADRVLAAAQPDGFLLLCAAQLDVLLEPVFASGKAAVVVPLAKILGNLHQRFPQAPLEAGAQSSPAREAANVRFSLCLSQCSLRHAR